MTFRKNDFSDSRSYAISVLCALFLVSLLLLSWFIVRAIHSAKQEIKSEMEIELARLESNFSDTIDHTFSIIKNINLRILENPRSKKHIDEILRIYHGDPSLTNAFSWTIFSWSDENYQIIVDAKYGIMKEPFDLSIRDYISLTEKEPGIFHLGMPVIGSTSKKWMIPGGVGLSDSKDNYLGATTIGFEIETLAKLLQQTIHNSNVNFMLYGKHEVPILRGNIISATIDKATEDNVNDIDLLKMLNELNSKEISKIFDISIFQKRHAFLAKKNG